MPTTAETLGAGIPARERILDIATELFAQRGIRDVGVDEIIARSAVAKATLYKHFPSKDQLALAFLQERERRWTFDYVDAESRRRGSTPEEQLLAIFDVFDEWFRIEGFEACSFINVLLEMGSEHPLGRASIGHLATIRDVVRHRAVDCGLRDPEGFAHSWHILMKGAIVAAAEGDVDAAKRARILGQHLLDEHR